MSAVKVWTGAEWKVATPENLKFCTGVLWGTTWKAWRPTQRGTAYWNLTTQQHAGISGGGMIGTPFTWAAGVGWRKTIGDFMEDQTITFDARGLGIPSIDAIPTNARWKVTWSAPARGSGGSLTVWQGYNGLWTDNPVVAGPTGGGIGWVSTYSNASPYLIGQPTWYNAYLHFGASVLSPTQWWDVQITELAIVGSDDRPITYEVPGNLRAWDGIRWVAP